MAEQPVFWLGGKPGTKDKGAEPPAAERYEDALRDACESCGYAVDEYVVALGGFGGWLAHLDHQGETFRLFWNGKTEQLTLEKLPARGSWQEVSSAATPDEGLPGFITAVKSILQAPPHE